MDKLVKKLTDFAEDEAYQIACERFPQSRVMVALRYES